MGPIELQRDIPHVERQRLVSLVTSLMEKIQDMFVALIRISPTARLRAAICEIVSNVFDP